MKWEKKRRTRMRKDVTRVVVKKVKREMFWTRFLEEPEREEMTT